MFEITMLTGFLLAAISPFLPAAPAEKTPDPRLAKNRKTDQPREDETPEPNQELLPRSHRKSGADCRQRNPLIRMSHRVA
jgi:hypothetical protein